MQSFKKGIARVMIILCLSISVTPSIATITNLPVVITAQAAAYSKETIKDVQKALNDSGYDCGTADGVIGKKTKLAIKKYQKDNDLKVTGIINKSLLKSLDITVTKVASSSTNQEYTVYITRTGSKYHRAGCRYLRQSQIAISLSDAKKEGYEPCSVCNP
jgi:Putative peptidoglycan-binding domain-containing protein